MDTVGTSMFDEVQLTASTVLRALYLPPCTVGPGEASTQAVKGLGFGLKGKITSFTLDLGIQNLVLQHVVSMRISGEDHRRLYPGRSV